MNRKNIPDQYRENSGTVLKPLMWMSVPEMYEAIKTMNLDRETYFQYLNEFHSRIVTVLSVISFAIFAAPLGIFDPRNPKAGKFIYMIIMMVVFYSISVQARALVLSGKAHQITLYLPIVLSLVVATISYIKINYDLSSLVDLFRSRTTFMKPKKEKNELH